MRRNPIQGHHLGDRTGGLQPVHDQHRRSSVNNRLKVLRAERNWTQRDLAEKLDVSRQSVNAIETGKYDPSLPLAFRVAELFGLAIEDVFESPSRRSSAAI
jgi:putative transcriptional regulator